MDKLTDESYWKSFFEEFSIETINLFNNRGFTYSIPKEEQIRSALYSYLKVDYPLIEIEPDLIKESNVIAEYDLRLISESDILVEIKRAWSLKGWMNKYSEWFNDWKKDIEKLDKLDNSEYSNPLINENHRKCFVLLTFSDDYKNIGKYRVKDMDEHIEKTWGHHFSFKSESKVSSENIFMNLFVWVSY